MNDYIQDILNAADGYDDAYLSAAIHAIDLYDRPEDVERSIIQFLSCGQYLSFRLTNPFSKRAWMIELFDVLKNEDRTSGFDDDFGYSDVKCAMVTFTHAGWCFPHNNIRFDLDLAKSKVAGTLKYMNFIGCFEVAYYSNEKWSHGGKQGNLVSYHCHAIVWTTSISKINRWRARQKAGFKAVLRNRSGIRIDRISNKPEIYKVLSYMAKMPVHAYRTVRGNEKILQRTVKLPYEARYVLFNAAKRYTLFDVWFGGREGQNILTRAKGRLAKKDFYQKMKRRRGA